MIPSQILSGHYNNIGKAVDMLEGYAIDQQEIIEDLKEKLNELTEIKEENEQEIEDLRIELLEKEEEIDSLTQELESYDKDREEY